MYQLLNREEHMTALFVIGLYAYLVEGDYEFARDTMIVAAFLLDKPLLQA
jgi:hypothetical protein